MQEKTERVLNRRRMRLFLDEVAASGETINSLYISAGADPPAAVALLADIGAAISKSETGAAVFLGRSRAIVVFPPFPIKETYLFPGCQVEPLRSLLTRDYKLALVLVRLGAYAIGVCEGEKLVASKVGTGLIHARHKKGGSSQQRYSLHREKQIESFVTRICGHIREKIEPRAKELDYVIYGGSRQALQALKKGCPFLEKLESRALPPLLDIPDPKQEVLEKTVGRVWSTRVIEYLSPVF